MSFYYIELLLCCYIDDSSLRLDMLDITKYRLPSPDKPLTANRAGMQMSPRGPEVTTNRTGTQTSPRQQGGTNNSVTQDNDTAYNSRTRSVVISDKLTSEQRQKLMPQAIVDRCDCEQENDGIESRPRMGGSPKITYEMERNIEMEKLLHRFDKILIDDRDKGDLTFKISSIEDNYVQNIYKAKALRAIHEKQSKKCESHKDDGPQTKAKKHNKHKMNNSEDNSAADINQEQSPVTKRKSKSDSPDFLTRHRMRMAKLKKRFFETNTPPTAFPSPAKGVGETTCQALEDLDNLECVDLDADTTNATSEIVDSVDTRTVETVNTECDATNECHTARECGADVSMKQQTNHSRHRRHRSADETPIPLEDLEELRMRWTSTPKLENSVVIAIDFGTTYSGYAYCYTNEPGIEVIFAFL